MSGRWLQAFSATLSYRCLRHLQGLRLRTLCFVSKVVEAPPSQSHCIRKSECEELGLEVNAKAALEDVGHNADLYIANQYDL